VPKSYTGVVTHEIAASNTDSDYDSLTGDVEFAELKLMVFWTEDSSLTVADIQDKILNSFHDA